MRMLLAALLIGHGAAHVVGFAVPWKLVSSTGVPYRTTVLAGSLDVGPVGVRALGMLWLVLSLGFVAAAVGLLQHTTWLDHEVLVLIVASVALCLLALPESRPGLVANAVILILWLIVSRIEG